MTRRVVIFCSLLVACGGGASNAVPLTPDPSSAEADAAVAEETPATEPDAGAPYADLPTLPPPAATTSRPEDAGAPPAPQTGGEEGARTLLAQFVAQTADHAALTRSLRPTTKDYKAMFDGSSAAKVEAAHAKMWNGPSPAEIKPRPNQTEVKVWSATGSELAKGTGSAKEFPSEYKKIGKHLAPALLFYRFKFVEPGKETGMAYDGLAYVNGHWVIAPKPWRAIEGKDDAEPEKEKVPAGKKKNPKPKKKK